MLKEKLKRLLMVILVFAAIAGAMCAADCISVFGFRRKPLFTPFKMTTDDGSGRYGGYLYSFIIEGEAMPEKPRKVVAEAELYVLGIRIATMGEDD